MTTEWITNPDNSIAICKGFCQETGEEYEVEVPLAQYDLFKKGVSAERSFSELDEDSITFIKTGYTPEMMDAIHSSNFSYSDNE